MLRNEYFVVEGETMISVHRSGSAPLGASGSDGELMIHVSSVWLCATAQALRERYRLSQTVEVGLRVVDLYVFEDLPHTAQITALAEPPFIPPTV